MTNKWFNKLQSEIVGAGFDCTMSVKKGVVTVKIVSPEGAYRNYTSSISDTINWIFHKQCIITTLRRYRLCH